MVDISAIAARLDTAAQRAEAIPQITGETGELPLADPMPSSAPRSTIGWRAARRWWA
jgi:2-oxo-3-hexenedioate decarboxylase